MPKKAVIESFQALRARLVAGTEKFRHWGERLRAIKRGSLGLPIDENAFNGMVDTNRIEERTRVTIEEQYWRTFIRMLGNITKIQFYADMADQLDHYGIAVDGKQWDAFIAMKTQQQSVNIQPVAVPSRPTEPQQDKKGEKK